MIEFSRSTHSPRVAWIVLAAIWTGLAGGCESTPTTAGQLTRTEQQLVTGMEAHRANRDWEAISALTPLVDDRDPLIAGRAAATLGLIYQSRGDHRKATDYLETAANKLEGNESAQAAYHLGRSHQKLGHWAEARTWLSLAQSRATDPSLREAAQRVQESTGYTIQLGAFSSKANAEKQAVAMRSAARSAGAGTPRVTPSVSASGKRLYLVQVGRFSTFDSAVAARRKLGRTNAIIVTGH